MFRADLHCHTHYSDGELSPQKLLCYAKEQGISAVSITDHDTVAAIHEAVTFAKELEIELLPGIEFTTAFQGKGVHILGYGISPDHSDLLNFCQGHHKRRTARLIAMVQNLQKEGLSLNTEKIFEKIIPTEAPGRRHLARAIVTAGKASTLKEAFIRYLRRGKAGEISLELPSLEETLAIIHAAGGIAVLAHPHLFSEGSAFVEKLLSFPIDGIECYYARFSRHVAEEWVAFAERRELIVTGGSDCHSLTPGEVSVGSSWIDLARFRSLKERLKPLS